MLIYSTCTYNREENEENVAFVCESLNAELLSINTDKFEGISRSDRGYRFYPHKIKGEGFFISVMRKVSENSRFTNIKTDRKKMSPCRQPDMAQMLKHPERFEILEEDGTVVAYPKIYVKEMLWIKQQLNCIENGLLLATIKGKDYIPSHQLALSKELNRENITETELDYHTAISYLKRNNIFLPDAPAGYVLVTYRQLGLGWVKNLGKRSNNLYPQHWRIRMNI